MPTPGHGDRPTQSGTRMAVAEHEGVHTDEPVVVEVITTGTFDQCNARAPTARV
jgi:hypothetical protein